jgi:hypothetical protein
MNKYVIEDGINFMDLLNSGSDDEPDNDDNLCLISYIPLINNPVALSCGHKFNYKPLYNDVIQQKSYLNLQARSLSINQFRCPYCRSIQDKLLPTISGYDKIRGVNSPVKYCMYLNKCSHTFKNGKKKGCGCDKNTNATYCNTHAKQHLMQNVAHTCAAVLKTGKRKGEMCGMIASPIYGLCNRHNKLNNNKKK